MRSSSGGSRRENCVGAARRRAHPRCKRAAYHSRCVFFKSNIGLPARVFLPREKLARLWWRAQVRRFHDAGCRPAKSEHGPRVRATGSSSTSEARSSRPPSPRSPPTRSSSAASSRAIGAPRTPRTRYSWTGTRTRSACCSRACGTARRYFPRRTRSSVPACFSSISTEQLEPKTIADLGQP